MPAGSDWVPKLILFVPAYTSCFFDDTVLPDMSVSSEVITEFCATVISNVRLLLNGLMILVNSKSVDLLYSWMTDEYFFCPPDVTIAILYHTRLFTATGSIKE